VVVSKRQMNEAIVVDVSGEVDMMSSPDLRRVLTEALRAKPRVLVVNLANVAYMDSSGIATLVECLQGTRVYGGKLRLVEMRREILDVFELARLDRVFEILATEEDALRKEEPGAKTR